MSFTPQDPNYIERVRASYGRQRVMETLGAKLINVGPGLVEIEIPYREDLTQQHGFLHAGIVTTVLDSACGYAAFSLMPANAAVLTVEFKVNLLAPAQGNALSQGAGSCAGKTLTVCSGEAFAVGKGDDEKIIATMLATLMALPEREDLKQ